MWAGEAVVALRGGAVAQGSQRQPPMQGGAWSWEDEWERGGTTIYISVNATRRRDGWDIVQQHVRQIVSWIKYYEMKEATTLFELALWKAKIDQVDEADRRDRDKCRVDVPGPVKDTILQYLL